MATQTSADADKVLASLDPNVRSQIISQGAGDRLTSGEATRLVSAYQANPYSATNINQTMTAPVAPPDYNDPLGYRTRLEGETGLTTARTNYQDLVNNVRKYDQTSLAQQNYLEGQTIRQGVITGQQANQARLRAQERTSLVDESQAAQDLLLAKQQEVSDRYGIYNSQREMMTNLILQNPGAKIKYTDTVEAASGKLEKYAVEAKKAAYKDSLKQIALQMGINTKGKSTKDLEKKISKTNKKALALARQQSELQLEGLKMDIANTKSIIAERGKGTGKSDADKLQKEFDSYAADVADKVSAGTAGYETREAAAAAIERRYPGEGSIIYRLIPDSQN